MPIYSNQKKIADLSQYIPFCSGSLSFQGFKSILFIFNQNPFAKSIQQLIAFAGPLLHCGVVPLPCRFPGNFLLPAAKQI